MNTAKLLFDAYDNDGGTYRAIGLDHFGNAIWEKSYHTEGYYVARARGVENLPSFGLSTEFIERFYLERLWANGLYLGLWNDEHGLWSVDVTEWHSDYRTALDTGHRNNQRAIWDVRAAQAIEISREDEWDIYPATPQYV